MSNLFLRPQPTLRNFQSYVDALVKERGFQNTTPKAFMHLLEECGELAKAVRALEKSADEARSSAQEQVGHEAADVLIFLLDICNRYEVDLEAAFRSKEEINKQRTWA